MLEESNKRKLIALFIFICLLIGLTFSSKLIFLINILAVRIILNCLLNIIIGLIAYIFIRKTNQQVDYGFKNYKSYLIGVIIALILQLLIGVIPALLGQSLVGSHRDFVLWLFVYNLFYYILIIGPVEELIFRVYIQDSLICLLPKHKWMGVLLSSLLFGFWHLINGNIIQVLFTSIIGCVFGFTKYLIKECKYSGVSLGHGLYDFLCFLTTIIVVK